MTDTAAAENVAHAVAEAAGEALAEVATDASAEASVDAALEAAADRVEEAQETAETIALAAVEAERNRNFQELAEGVAQCQNAQAQQSEQLASMAQSLTTLEQSMTAITDRLAALPVVTVEPMIPASPSSTPPLSEQPIVEAVTQVLPETAPAVSEAVHPAAAQKRHRWI